MLSGEGVRRAEGPNRWNLEYPRMCEQLIQRGLAQTRKEARNQMQLLKCSNRVERFLCRSLRRMSHKESENGKTQLA